MTSTVETAIEIRPSHVDIPDEALDDLRRRIEATNWPEKETVADQSQGVPLALIQEARTLLGDGVRLAQVRSEAEGPAAVRHRDRWARHSLHSRSFASTTTRCRSSSITAGPARSSSS